MPAYGSLSRDTRRVAFRAGALAICLIVLTALLRIGLASRGLF